MPGWLSTGTPYTKSGPSYRGCGINEYGATGFQEPFPNPGGCLDLGLAAALFVFPIFIVDVDLSSHRCVLPCGQFSSYILAMSRAHPSVAIPFATPRIDAFPWTVFPTPPSPRMSLTKQRGELFYLLWPVHSSVCE